MKTITLSGQSKEDFLSHLFKQIKITQENGQSLIGVFLAYDFGDIGIKKMLEDESYWNALNSETSDIVDIYYINPTPISKQRFAETTGTGKEADQFFLLPGNEKNQELKPLTIENHTDFKHYPFYILDHLGYDDYENPRPRLPFMIFLRIDNEGTLTHNFAVSLKRRSEEAKAFKEINKIMEGVIKQLSHIDRTNNPDPQTILSLAQQGTTFSIIKKGAFLFIGKLAPKLIQLLS